jgi:hypothetical protein
MTSEARAALEVIRRAIEDERYIVTNHFSERMDKRGLMWPTWCRRLTHQPTFVTMALIDEAVPNGWWPVQLQMTCQ